jgi:hypothetical protein
MILYSVSLAEADECSHRVLEESITDDARREPFRPAEPSVNLVVLAEGEFWRVCWPPPERLKLHDIHYILGMQESKSRFRRGVHVGTTP